MDFIKAIQQTIDDAELEYRYFPGFGVAVSWPQMRCSKQRAGQGWSATDYERDDVYAGVRCQRRHWEAGGELIL